MIVNENDCDWKIGEGKKFSSGFLLRDFVYVSRVASRILQYVPGLRADRYLNNKYKRGSL